MSLKHHGHPLTASTREAKERHRTAAPAHGMGFAFGSSALSRAEFHRWKNGLSPAELNAFYNPMSVLVFQVTASRPGSETFNRHLTDRRGEEIINHLQQIPGFKAQVRIESLGEGPAKAAHHPEHRDNALDRVALSRIHFAPPPPPAPLSDAGICPRPNENFPYDAETFSTVKRLAPLILKNSQRFSVPPIAVAGSIADEFNTQRGFRRGVDWLQDHVLLRALPNFAIENDARIGYPSKMYNATYHDLGIGNIKLKTAKEMFDLNRETFDRPMNYSELVTFLNTDEGTVHVAALVIQKGKQDLEAHVKGMSDERIEGIYVTYYKQGPSYIDRYLKAAAAKPGKRIEPGEGCRVMLQREQFKQALGLQ